jgi:hypothetical protein
MGPAGVAEQTNQLRPAKLRHELGDTVRITVAELGGWRGDDRQHALKKDARRPNASRIKSCGKLKESRHDSALTLEIEGFGRDREAPVVVRLRGGQIAGITNAIPSLSVCSGFGTARQVSSASRIPSPSRSGGVWAKLTGAMNSMAARTPGSTRQPTCDREPHSTDKTSRADETTGTIEPYAFVARAYSPCKGVPIRFLRSFLAGS